MVRCAGENEILGDGVSKDGILWDSQESSKEKKCQEIAEKGGTQFCPDDAIICWCLLVYFILKYL